jgi:uncharacterized membrane protein YecN with MAPEG domain
MSPFPALITVLTLMLYFAVTLNVGRARVKYKVSPPQMTGDPDFERVVRVQQNTLEQLPLFLPALWLFAQFVNPLWSAGLGAIWLIGRVLYAWGYYQAVKQRTVGFGISALATVTLILGALVGICLTLPKAFG